MKTKIVEHIDFEKVNTLLEGFNQSTGFVTAILDLDGNVLSKSGWRQICTKFHRINPETSQRCTFSDTVLAGQLAKGEKYHFYKCLNGLVDVAVPIIIRGEHIANLFSGQFFFEKPDNSFFQKQAAKFGFNESVYLKALGDVPIISEEKVKVIMEFLLNMTHLISDMTLQKLELIEMYEALRESEERFRLMIKNSNDAFVLINEKAEQFYISDAAVRDTGYTVDELKGPIQNVIHPEDWEIVNKAWSEILSKKGETVRIHYRHMHKYNGYIWYEAVAQNFMDNSAINAVVVNVRDITAIKENESELIKAKKKAEEGEIRLKIKNNELNEKNEFIQTILDNLPIGLALNKFDGGQAIYMNKKFEEIYGWNANEINSVASFFELVYPDEEYRKSLMNRIMADINSGDPEKMHWENIHLTRKDGTIRIVNAVNIPLIEQNTMVSTVMDVTELHQIQTDLQLAKEHAEESDRLKTAFLQNMSHEIRTPMNAIMGFSSLLFDNANNKTKLKDFTNIISQRCNDLLDIINDILDISKIESGQLPVHFEETNLSELFTELNSFFSEYQKRIGKQQIKFSLQAFNVQEQNLIITDNVKLKQIFINLISNAFKFTDDGKIECGCKFDENHNLLFYVSDTGMGIPSDKQQYIFERFTQLQNGTKKNIGGTGLGLPIVKALVGLLGGQVFLESEPLEGSTFSFSIPNKPARLLPHQTSINENINEEYFIGKTILIVEDDPYNAEYIKEVLSGFGFNILQVGNGEDAVEISLSQQIDLILMDINLPNIDGYEAIRQIRQHKPHLKIIAQTAYATQGEKEKALRAGCIDYVSKPTKREVLLSVLNKHLKEQK